jgi:alginate O-acetyltransferase complex protein AlgJ
MKNPTKLTTWQKYYSWLFVLALTFSLMYTMLMSYRQGYEQFENNFFQRNFLIENFNHLRIKLGDRVFPQVLIGKNGWMEYSTDNNLDDFQHAVGFSNETLQIIADKIKACNEYAQKQNITFLIVAAPDKVSIYPDKLPEQIQKLDGQSRLDQLNAYLKTQNLPEIIDLRPALLNARQQQDVYYKTNTHWNVYGAYTAYTEIIHVLAKTYPNQEAYPVKFFHIHETPPLVHDLPMLIQANFIVEPGLQSELRANDFVQRINLPDTYGYNQISWIPNSHAPTLLIFHDSFGYALNSLLEVNFSKTYFIHRSSSASFLNKKNIEQFEPNILIFEIVERDLHALQDELTGCATE